MCFSEYKTAANYSACSGPPTGSSKNQNLRMGNNISVLKGRTMIYTPIERKNTSFNPSALPINMLKGKRRYTPEVKRRMMENKMKLRRKSVQSTLTVSTTKKMAKKQKITTKLNNLITFVIKQVPIVKNGKKMFEVVKGFRRVTKKMNTDIFK